MNLRIGMVKVPDGMTDDHALIGTAERYRAIAEGLLGASARA
jgi:hypothetical protein